MEGGKYPLAVDIGRSGRCLGSTGGVCFGSKRDNRGPAGAGSANGFTWSSASCSCSIRDDSICDDARCDPGDGGSGTVLALSIGENVAESGDASGALNGEVGRPRFMMLILDFGLSPSCTSSCCCCCSSSTSSSCGKSVNPWKDTVRPLRCFLPSADATAGL